MWAKDRELPVPEENIAFQKQEKFRKARNPDNSLRKLLRCSVHVGPVLQLVH